jgi:hypothetical protein
MRFCQFYIQIRHRSLGFAVNYRQIDAGDNVEDFGEIGIGLWGFY